MKAKVKNFEPLVKKVAKGASISFGGSILSKGLKFGLHLLLARMLGVSAYGIYVLGFSVVTIAAQFSMLGLQNGIVRFVSLYNGIGDTKRVKGTLISAFIGAISFSVITGVFLFLFSSNISMKIFSEPSLSPVLKAFSISLPFYVLMLMASYSARAFKVMKYDVAVRNISFPTINLCLVALAFLLGFKLLGAVYAFLISASLSAILGLYFIKRIFPEISSGLEHYYEFIKLIRFSLPVFLAGFSFLILTQTDRVMIGYFMRSSEVGIYNAALIISVLQLLVLDSINAIFAPIISDLYNRKEFKKLDHLFKITTRWIFTLTFPVILISIIFPKEILGSIFGSEFISAWPVLVILSVVVLIGAGTGSVGYMLIMTGKQNVDLANTATAMVVNVGLNIWFIQSYGIFGAALATGISRASVNIAEIVETHKMIGIQPYDRKYYKPLFAGATAVLVTMFLNKIRAISGLNWVMGIIIFFVIYLVSLLFLGLEKEDADLFQEGFKRLSMK